MRMCSESGHIPFSNRLTEMSHSNFTSNNHAYRANEDGANELFDQNKLGHTRWEAKKEGKLGLLKLHK